MIRSIIIIFSSLFIIGPSLAATDEVAINGIIQENHQQACLEILAEKAPDAAAHCSYIFPRQADCCLKEAQIPTILGCVKIPNRLHALQCYTELTEYHARKSLFTKEQKPGLVDKFIRDWKGMVYADCINSKDNVTALECSHIYLMIHRKVYEYNNWN